MPLRDLFECATDAQSSSQTFCETKVASQPPSTEF